MPSGPPPSYPQEHSLEHRKFLLRSLERNDTDLAALVELNRSLKKVKASIIDECGEAVLLDLGQGILKLSLTEDSVEGTGAAQLSDEAQDLCLDFLLRMKLRRKLLNRLARRLNRVAHAMDGEDVTPPPPPKYGDLRLHIDGRAVEVYAEHWKRQAEAQIRIANRKYSNVVKSEWTQEEEDAHRKKYSSDDEHPSEEEVALAKVNEVKATLTKVKEEREEATTTKETNAVPAAATVTQEPSAVEEPSAAVTTEEEPSTAVKENEKSEETPTDMDIDKEEKADMPKEGEGKPEVGNEQPEETVKKEEKTEVTSEEKTEVTTEEKIEENSEEKIDEKTEENAEEKIEEKAQEKIEEKAVEKIEEKTVDAPVVETKDDKTTAEVPPVPTEPNPEPTPSKPAVAESLYDPMEYGGYSLEEDYDVLKAYTDAYERVYDPATGTYKYSILEQEHEEDYQAIKYGAGIGATHRSMSSKEKEMEAKRWQAAILNRIPEQPTFEMLGMENRVFELEERRKRILQQAEVSSPKKKSKKEDSDDDNESDDNEDDDEDENMTTPNKTKTDDKKSPKKQESDAKEALPVVAKPVKAMSLAAVPSFYDQDLQRIRLVHADLMETSIHEHARSRLAEATNDYNNAFRMSNDLYDRRTMLQNQLNNLILDSRAKVAKLKNDYALQVVLERNRWQKRKDQFDAQRMQALMPTRMGRHPVGTPYISSYARSCRDRNGIFVAECLGDIVDAVVTIRDNNIKGFDGFIPPPGPDIANLVEDQSTGETFAQRQARIEQSVKKELNNLSLKLQASEDERRRAWRKMLKIKAEFEAPSHRFYLNAARERIPIDSGNYHMHPVPPLRSSHLAVMPQPMPLSNSTVGSYTPNPSSLPLSAQHDGSMSKYSAARVRERISADGTVAPVSEPKKTKDGLFQRPAGRTRKGMSWDAVRGIWVPANER